MMRNPEFVRNLWLVHSPIWMVLKPFMLGAAFLVILGLEALGEPDMIFGRPQWEVYAFGLFAIVTILAGAGKATAAIATELAGHTWDGQRMSAIPPWSMAWGKLLGSTAFTWYGGLICILLYAYAAQSQGFAAADILGNVTVWVLSALIAQSNVMVSTLAGLLKSPLTERQTGVSITTAVGSFLSYLVIPALWLALPQDHSVIWFGWRIGAMDFLILSAAAFAMWSLTGLHYAMRREFQYVNSPLPWLGFAVFTIAYASGFEPGNADPLQVLSRGRRVLDGLLPFYVGVLLVYSVALVEPINWRLVRRIGRAVDRRDWTETADLTPRAIFTLALLALVVCSLVLAGDDTLWPTLLGAEVTGEVLIAAFLFVARDIALILILGIALDSKASEFAALGCLLALQAVLPATALLFAEPLLPLFWPVPGNGALLTIGLVLAQVVAIYVVLGRRVIGVHREKL